jgi:hypothetical protein
MHVHKPAANEDPFFDDLSSEGNQSMHLHDKADASLDDLSSDSDKENADSNSQNTSHPRL